MCIIEFTEKVFKNNVKKTILDILHLHSALYNAVLPNLFPPPISKKLI